MPPWYGVLIQQDYMATTRKNSDTVETVLARTYSRKKNRRVVCSPDVFTDDGDMTVCCYWLMIASEGQTSMQLGESEYPSHMLQSSGTLKVMSSDIGGRVSPFTS
jgi:hypothetical protein